MNILPVEDAANFLSHYNEKTRIVRVLEFLKNKPLIIFLLYQLEAVEKLGWTNLRHHLSCEPPDTSRLLKPILENAIKDVIPSKQSLMEFSHWGKKHSHGLMVAFIDDIILHRVWIIFHEYHDRHPEIIDFDDRELLLCLQKQFDLMVANALEQSKLNPCTKENPCEICHKLKKIRESRGEKWEWNETW